MGTRLCQMLDVFSYKDKIHLVLEHCCCSLDDVICDKAIELDEADIKSFIRMALVGVGVCHGAGMLHRVSACSNATCCRISFSSDMFVWLYVAPSVVRTSSQATF